jgi:hypothetical protein
MADLLLYEALTNIIQIDFGSLLGFAFTETVSSSIKQNYNVLILDF